MFRNTCFLFILFYASCAASSVNHNCGILDTTIWCDSQDFITFPKNFPKNITKIYIIHSWIRSMKSLSLYKNLEEINIISSYIEDANFRKLKSLSKLYYLDLEGNSLKRFNFNNIKESNLTTLILKDNSGIKLTGSGGNSLRDLDLEGCGLLEIPMKQIRQFKNLRTLNLANNFIEKLPEDLMEAFPKLMDLKLSGNLLKCEDDLKKVADICFNEDGDSEDVKISNKKLLDVLENFYKSEEKEKSEKDEVSYQPQYILIILILILAYVLVVVIKIGVDQYKYLRITEKYNVI